jgi:hypothetical protein
LYSKLVHCGDADVSGNSASSFFSGRIFTRRRPRRCKIF